jgi:hypothetical protein
MLLGVTALCVAAAAAASMLALVLQYDTKYASFLTSWM